MARKKIEIEKTNVNLLKEKSKEVRRLKLQLTRLLNIKEKNRKEKSRIKEMKKKLNEKDRDMRKQETEFKKQLAKKDKDNLIDKRLVRKLQTKVSETDLELEKVKRDFHQHLLRKKHVDSLARERETLAMKLAKLKKDTNWKQANLKREVLKRDKETKELQEKMAILMEREFTCSICSEIVIEGTSLNCSHLFCQFCISRWQDKKIINTPCPICFETIRTNVRSLAVNNYLEKGVELLSKKHKQKRKLLIKERKLEQTRYDNQRACNANMAGGNEDSNVVLETIMIDLRD